MRKLFLLSGIACLTVASAFASTITYDTTGTTLTCGTALSCVSNAPNSVTLGGTLTLTYLGGAGTNILTPSVLNFGSITTTGTGNNINVQGLLLTIVVFSTPPSSGAALPNGTITGTISTNTSGGSITFSPNNTTTGFGTLPGIVISGGGQSFAYQVLNPVLGLQSPTVGNPVGLTSIQGAVTDVTPASIPEPGSLGIATAGLGMLAFFLRRKK